MPMMQAFVERLNVRFNRWNIGDVDVANLAGGITLAQAAEQSQQGKSSLKADTWEVDYLQDFLGHFTEQERNDLRNILHEAVDHAYAQDRWPVQFLWAPSDDQSYHLEFWKVDPSLAAPPSKTAVSVLFRSPQQDAPWQATKYVHAQTK